MSNLTSYFTKRADDKNVDVYSAGITVLSNPSFAFKRARDLEDAEFKEVLGFGNHCTDYGNGMYLCQERIYADKWVNMYFGGTGIINHYSLDLNNLRIKHLDIYSDEDMLQYMCLLLDNTNSIPYDNIEVVKIFLEDNFDRSIYDFDIIIGPRLDSSYMKINNALTSTSIDKDLFRQFIGLYDLSDQTYIQS